MSIVSPDCEREMSIVSPDCEKRLNRALAPGKAGRKPKQEGE